MNRLALHLAFFAAGFSFLTVKLGVTFGIDQPLILALMLFLPAAVLGVGSWWTEPSFARSWPVVACVALAWLGLVVSIGGIHNRGLLAVCVLTLPLPIAALIVRERALRSCATTYVLASVAAVLLTLWFQYEANGGSITASLRRFGSLYSADGMRVTNPNSAGVQFAFAAVLAFALYVTHERRVATTSGASERLGVASALDGQLAPVWFVLLALACLLTASRAALVALVVALAILAIWGTRRLDAQRMRDLVALALIGVGGLAIAAVGVGFQPWSTVAERIGDLGGLIPWGRLRIWHFAFELWATDLRLLLVGAGTGQPPELLGPHMLAALNDWQPRQAIDAHNSAVEWVLCHGLLGVALAGVLLWHFVRRVVQLDRCDATAWRTALAVGAGLLAMCICLQYRFHSIPVLAILLAMASGPPPLPARVPAEGVPS